MKDAKLHLLILTTLSVSGIASYLAMFHFVSAKTVSEMTASPVPGQNVHQQLQEKQKELEDVLTQLKGVQSTLQSTTQNYQQAYSVIQRDDQVLQVLNQRLQGMGIKPVTLPKAPKPLQGINISSTPPPIQTASRAS